MAKQKTNDAAPAHTSTKRQMLLGRARLISLLVLVGLLAATLVFLWVTRDAMEQLSFLRAKGQQAAQQGSQTLDGHKTLVDLRPWQTAVTLTALAVTNEELDFAHQAEHLADHEVDQAFASAIRQASARVQKRVLKGESLALSQKVNDLERLVKEDQAQVEKLGPKPGSESTYTNSDADDLEIAKAQLGLDTDQLNDAQDDLARASGDDRSQIQSELQEHEAAMKKYDSQAGGNGAAQVAVQSARKSRSLAERWAVWNAQTSRYKLLRQAVDQARADIKNLTAEHNQLEAQADAVLAAAKAESAAPSSAGSGGATDHASRLASLRERSAERQLLSLYDDRIQTEERLADVYDKWSAQVLLQHRIVLHLMLQSGALIAFILICVLLADSYLQRLTLGAVADAGAGAASDRRRLLTLRSILQLGVQLVGAGFILLVVFGVPRQISTIVGLATAGLTVVMQDFIIAFFGWFVLMGKNGIRVGDWVEINGVGGEVTEVGLFRTTMLETGNWTDKGHPTGRRVTFINSFAIRGQFFNFSTAGQWMWDEIAVTVPSTMDSTVLAQSIHDAVLEETKKDVGVAEQEWQRGTRNDGLSQFTAEPTVNLRPSGAGVDVLVRYVTRASDRYEMRNRLFQRVLDVLRKPEPAAETGAAGPA